MFCGVGRLAFVALIVNLVVSPTLSEEESRVKKHTHNDVYDPYIHTGPSIHLDTHVHTTPAPHPPHYDHKPVYHPPPLDAHYDHKPVYHPPPPVYKPKPDYSPAPKPVYGPPKVPYSDDYAPPPIVHHDDYAAPPVVYHDNYAAPPKVHVVHHDEYLPPPPPKLNDYVSPHHLVHPEPKHLVADYAAPHHLPTPPPPPPHPSYPEIHHHGTASHVDHIEHTTVHSPPVHVEQNIHIHHHLKKYAQHDYSAPECAYKPHYNINATFCLEDDYYPVDTIKYELKRNLPLLSRVLSDVAYQSADNLVDGLSKYEEEKYSYYHYFGEHIHQDKRHYQYSPDYYKHGGYICPSDVYYGRPKRAVNTYGVWKVIINLPEKYLAKGYGAEYAKYTQTERLEQCLYPDLPCSYIHPAVKSSCLQKYKFVRLLAYTRVEGLHVDSFRLPSACSCHVHDSYSPY